MTPAVSVVIATYNYGRYLAGALDSVLAQTIRDLEIIVVDDGSSDDTRDVIAPYLSDPRVTYHRTDHLGQPAAKNRGIQLASAPLVAFLDADDLWLPTKLERQIALFRAAPELGVAYTRRAWIDEAGRDLDREERPLHRGDVLAPMFLRNFICFSSTMIRREVFEDVGMFDEQIPMSIDYDLWLRAALKYRFDYVDERLVKYRTGHANLSRRLPERVRCVRVILDRFLDEYGGRQRLDPALVRRSLAEHHLDVAMAFGRPSRKAIAPFLRALSLRPGYPRAWRVLLTSWWPESFKVFIRRAKAKASNHGASTGGAGFALGVAAESMPN